MTETFKIDNLPFDDTKYKPILIRKNLPFINCEFCNQLFKLTSSNKNQRFCKRACVDNWRSQEKTGKNHHNWKGGFKYRYWKSRRIIAFKKKQIGKCEKCHCKDKQLQGHHILKYSESIDTRAEYDNIKILCINCHALEHPEYKNFILSLKDD